MSFATHFGWAIKWSSNNALDGYREHLLGRYRLQNGPDTELPSHLAGHNIMLFKTRFQAQQYIRKHYGYLLKRRDLKAEPHGWHYPKPVKVRVDIVEVVRANAADAALKQLGNAALAAGG